MNQRRLNGAGKTPNVRRCSRIRSDLANDLFNQSHEWVDTTKVDESTKQYNMADLFSGAGGIAQGFRMAGFKPIYGVELDPDAFATFRRNFPNAEHVEGLIEKISDEEAVRALRGEQVHVLCAGFPCQGFSVAGDRNPRDQRNHLYHQFVRFARLFKPWYVVGENVPGIVTLDRGSFYKSILASFEEIGYPNMSVQILESAAYGVPQLRPRTIFVANRFGLPNPYPKPILSEKDYVPIEKAIEDLKTHPRDPSINHEWTRHTKDMERRLAKVEAGGSLYESYLDAWKRQYPGVPAMTIKENHGGVHIHYELNRTISAREMARLQSFPDEFLFCGRMKRVMFQVGNAVPPLLAKHIGLALLPSFGLIEREVEAGGKARGD